MIIRYTYDLACLDELMLQYGISDQLAVELIAKAMYSVYGIIVNGVMQKLSLNEQWIENWVVHQISPIFPQPPHGGDIHCRITASSVQFEIEKDIGYVY